MWNTVEKKGHALKIKIAHPSSKNWLSIHNTKGAAIWFRVIQPTIQSFMNTYKQNAQYNRAQGQGPTEGQPMHSKWKLVTQVQKLITYSKTKGVQSGLGNPTHNPFIHEHTGTQCTYKHNKRPAHALKNEKWTPKFKKPYIVKKKTLHYFVNKERHLRLPHVEHRRKKRNLLGLFDPPLMRIKKMLSIEEMDKDQSI